MSGLWKRMHTVLQQINLQLTAIELALQHDRLLIEFRTDNLHFIRMGANHLYVLNEPKFHLFPNIHNPWQNLLTQP
ncbi:MAG: hypothetical protein BGO59_27030 [Spirosoma sp. 48-14]|nr:MAG: hypothetical protein BGO59_27030 [Spirosoma sp. 48-14]